MLFRSAGKSTLLKILSGVEQPDAGTMEINGKRESFRSPTDAVRAGVGVVHQEQSLFTNLTVAENLAMGAYLVSDKAEVKRRSDAIIARFPRLGERRTQQAGYLSGGEQQMLAIGRAMMAKPELLLLDEPSMGLAPLIVEEIFRIILQIRSEGSTVLLVEQNAHAALEISDYSYVIESGKIALEGTGAEVAHNPAVMAAYLGI